VKGQKTLFSKSSDESDEWATPKALIQEIEAEFGKIELDPCCTAENCKGQTGYDKDADGLSEPWTSKLVFVNPPYSDIKSWVRKCYEECIYYGRAKTIVLLIPARTDTIWFHNHIWDRHLHKPQRGREVRFLKGRLRFEGGLHPAPFPSMLVIWRRDGT